MELLNCAQISTVDPFQFKFCLIRFDPPFPIFPRSHCFEVFVFMTGLEQ
jgi:hypothetical protein